MQFVIQTPFRPTECTRRESRHDIQEDVHLLAPESATASKTQSASASATASASASVSASSASLCVCVCSRMEAKPEMGKVPNKIVASADNPENIQINTP